MSKSAEYDYLILGQGLAGSLLGWNLMRQGCRVMLIDDAHESSSSMVAAGLINPLAGWRLVLPEDIDAWLAAASETYGLLERSAGKPLYHQLNMLRLFQDAGQLRFWERLRNQSAAKNFSGKPALPMTVRQGISAPFGGFTQYHTGYLDLPEAAGTFSGAVRTLKCTHHRLPGLCRHPPGEKHVSWGRFSADQLVCCEGWRAQANPWFGWLPFTPDKGEFLTLEGGILPEQIINGRHMAIPLATGSLRFGSTHEHQSWTTGPPMNGRQQLLTGLHQLLSNGNDFRVRSHQAGVRPATQDRQPLLGTHPEHRNLHIFNGFGAKGTLTIPWHAQRFTRYLQEKLPLPGLSDISRFKIDQPEQNFPRYSV